MPPDPNAATAHLAEYSESTPARPGGRSLLVNHSQYPSLIYGRSGCRHWGRAARCGAPHDERLGVSNRRHDSPVGLVEHPSRYTSRSPRLKPRAARKRAGLRQLKRPSQNKAGFDDTLACWRAMRAVLGYKTSWAPCRDVRSTRRATTGFSRAWPGSAARRAQG